MRRRRRRRRRKRRRSRRRKRRRKRRKRKEVCEGWCGKKAGLCVYLEMVANEK